MLTHALAALGSSDRWRSEETSASSLAVVRSTPALICDTSALLEYLVEGAPDHRRFRSAIDAARTRYVPALVLPELDYFLPGERRAIGMFLEDLRRGAFTYAPAPLDLLFRAAEVDAHFADLKLGLVDASIVALAETIGVRRLATRDVRHFAAVRLRDGRSFELVVNPSIPESPM